MPFDAHYICQCAPSFSGQTCGQDVNECAQSPSPCRNGGVCRNVVGSYRCQCPREYAGQNCERRHLPCSPSPCHNRGTCAQRGHTSQQWSCVPGNGRYPFLGDRLSPNP